MVWQDIPQIPFQINMQDDNWLEQLRQSNQAENLFNQYDDDTLKRNILNGLNMGNKYVADMQSLNNINIPKTNEEIESARAGNFNTLGNALSGNIQAQPNNWQRFVMGYQDNYGNSFNPNNLSRGTNKNWANRLGEGLGTVGRFIDSPLGRGLMAAGLNKALGYDDSFLEGLQAYAGRQNAVTADKLYRNQLKQYGYTDDDLRQIRGNITSDMYKNLSNNLYRNKQLETRIAIANAKDKNTQAKMILDAYNHNVLSEQDALLELAKYGIDLNQLAPSNETQKTQSQIKMNNVRANAIKNPPVRKTIIEHRSTSNNTSANKTNSNDKPKKKTQSNNDPLGIR